MKLPTFLIEPSEQAPSASSGKHEIIVVVGLSSRDAARAVEEETLAALARLFPIAEFQLTVVDADFVDDGRYMVIPCRGSVGDDQPLKPLPPARLVDEVEEALRDRCFLEPASVN
jgi:hypothetical protein